MNDDFKFILKYFYTYSSIILLLLIGLILQKIFFKNEDFLIIEGKYRGALEKLLIVTQNKHSRFKYYLRIAYCYYMLGEINQAIEYFERVLTLKRKNLISNLYLSILYAEKNDFKKAMLYFDNITSISKQLYKKVKIKEFEINDVQGWIYYKQKRKKEAISCYEKAMKKSEKHLNTSKKTRRIKGTPLFFRFGKIYLERNTPMFYRFGIIYKERNMKEKAKKEFEKAIEFGSSENIFSIKSKEELKKL